MLLEQVISKSYDALHTTVAQQCSDFIIEAQGLCLLKNLPTTYSNIHKVKARKRNIDGKFAETFNEAFNDSFQEIAQRAIFANGQASFVPTKGNLEPFYVFPINEYQYIYSAEVDNSSENYKQVIEVMFEQFGSKKGKTIVSELLKFTYAHDKLAEGIEKGSEIVFYDIPYYYAIRTSLTSNYEELLSILQLAK